MANEFAKRILKCTLPTHFYNLYINSPVNEYNRQSFISYKSHKEHCTQTQTRPFSVVRDDISTYNIGTTPACATLFRKHSINS